MVGKLMLDRVMVVVLTTDGNSFSSGKGIAAVE
jgi:hypothetical protein